MNLLRKQLRDFTKDRFNAAAQPLFVIMHGQGISPFGVSFAPDQQVDLFTFSKRVFPLVESISGICRDLCPGWQGERQVGQSGDIRQAGGQDTELHRHAVNRSQDLHSHTVKSNGICSPDSRDSPPLA